MHSQLPPLLASRFVALGDGTSLDLATGDRVWIERRVLDEAARVAWPEMVSRLWQLWHPAVARCVDFGFASAAEWFEAYALRPRDVASDASSPQTGSARAFFRANGLSCGVSGPQRRLQLAGVVPAMPDSDEPGPDQVAGPGLGMRLVPRPLEAHVLTALDDRHARGPRIWSVDAPVGSGWRTCWRRIAREARLRGYVPVDSGVLESAVRRPDSRHTSWLALLDGFALLVLHERRDWHLPDRQGLARLLVRIGGVDTAGTIVLDVVRRGRPRPAAHVLEPIAIEDLAEALWVSPGCCSPQWLRARAIAASAHGLPGEFVKRVAVKLGLRADVPTVHEHAPEFHAADVEEGGTEIDPGGVIAKARLLAAAGRTASALRRVQRAAWACARRRGRVSCARLLVEASRLEALRGDMSRSRQCWREAGRFVPASHSGWLVDGAADVAEQWMRQAALVDAEYLLHSALGAARVLDAPQPARLIALLVTCQCWQARWADALRQAGDDAGLDTPIALARVWARLELRDTAGAMSDLNAVGSAATNEAPGARLRADVASGAVAALMSAASCLAQESLPPQSLADDDRVLVPAEGLIRHGVVLPEPLTRRLRALARQDVARLVRARARLALALASAAPADRVSIAEDVARVARSTHARALVAGRALVSAWPAPLVVENPPMLDDLVAVLRACQAHDDPRAALPSVCQLLLARLDGSAVLVAGVAARGTVALARMGQGELVPAAERAARLGQSVVECESGATRCAVPVRLGEVVVGALVCHWAMPEAGVGTAQRTLLEAAAIAVAPTVRLAVELAQRPPVRAEISSLLGLSPAMAAVRAAVEAASRVPFTVLIEGESGSGKELVAREIHRLGPRRARSFCAVNCAALTDDLCEAELFGHARGAFTGAVGERAGLFEDADGGTLFLDEVSELSPRAQAKLLRAIQEGEIRRLGETRSRRVDVRLVAATNRRLADLVTSGAFRADLRYRLDVVHITVPPLRDRPDDVPLLAQHFWESATDRVGSHARLLPETLAALARYDWPGNVRELQNALAALAVHAPRHGVVPVTALPTAIGRTTPLGGVTLEQARRLVDERLVRAALAQAGGHRGRAASALGVTRQGLAKLVDRLRLDRDADRAAPVS